MRHSIRSCVVVTLIAAVALAVPLALGEWDYQSELRNFCFSPQWNETSADFHGIPFDCEKLKTPSEQDPMPAAYNYAQALQHTVFFYEAQRSGKLPSSNRVTWRGDSFMNDGKDIGKDLTGGWFDAGDRVKSTQTISYAATTLAWSTFEFASGFQKANTMTEQLNNLVWAGNYLIKCHLSTNELVAQVGDFIWDHEYWGAPESIPSDSNASKRPTYVINTSKPGTEVSAQTAAAMAAISVVIRKHRSSSVEFADDLLNRAKKLFTFAVKYPGSINKLNPDRKPHVFPQVGNGQEFYWSYSGYNDEVAWAAIWLYVATKDMTYWNEAVNYYNKGAGYNGEAFDWDSKWPAVKAMMAKYGPSTVDKTKYNNAAQAVLNYWSSTSSGMKYTPGGLAFYLQWGSARYSGLMSLVAMAYATTPGVPSSKVTTYVNFATRQVDYMLGSNPNSRSLLVGFGKNPPVKCHHAAASGYTGWGSTGYANPNPNKYVIYGALVGGPYCDAPKKAWECDTYKDNRDDYIRNEVTLDYTAGIQGALARLVMISTNVQPDDAFCPNNACIEANDGHDW